MVAEVGFFSFFLLHSSTESEIVGVTPCKYISNEFVSLSNHSFK